MDDRNRRRFAQEVHLSFNEDGHHIGISAATTEGYSTLVDFEAPSAWVSPGDMTGTIERFDPHSGGHYRMVLKQLDRSESHRKTTSVTDVVEARFTDLALTWVFHAVDFVAHDPSCETSMIMRWAIAELDGGARVEITADHVPDVVPEEDQAAGLKSSLAKLAEHLAK